MSIHIELSEEAKRKLEKDKKVSTISSLVVAVMTIFLLALILGLFILPNFTKEEVQIVTYTANSTKDDEPVAEKVKTNVQRKPSAPSSAPVKTIVAATTSVTSIPTVDAVEPVESIEFGAGDDFGAGWGSGSGSGSGGGGTQTAFGRTGGGGLEGTFFDLKQTRSKKDSKIGKYYKENEGIGPRQGYMKSEFRDLEKSRFSESSLREFFSSASKVSFTDLVMTATTKAEEGPKSFGVQKDVEPSGWTVVYEGTITPQKPGEYQFVGLFDDVMFVYVNDRMVLDGSLQSFYTNFPKPKMGGTTMRPNTPLIEGKWVKLTPGTRIKIVVAESPGGSMGGGLFIREKGKTYRQEKGADVLPPFAVGAVTKADVRKLNKIETVGSGTFPIETKDIPVFFSP